MSCEEYSALTFTACGYANFANGVIDLSVYGSDVFNDNAPYDWYGNPCSERTLIKSIKFSSGTTYTIDVSNFKYVCFDAKNNNDAYAGVELRHITLT